MPTLPVLLYRAAQVRELDRSAIEDHGIPGITLMQRAGSAAWGLLKKTWPQAGKIAVVCGSGNNAGDGYILAGLALLDGYDVELFALGDPARLHGDAARAAGESLALVPVQAAPEPVQLLGADVIVDAILGTGLDRDVSGNYLQAIAAINQSARPVLAIDIPSGLNADTGKIMGAAVHADVTLSFIGLKQGMFTGQGAECCGKIVFDDLDIPAAVYDAVDYTCKRTDFAATADLLPRRSAATHKGSYGHVLLVGGDYGYAGAIRMAAEAAARSGAGLVSIATRAEHAVSVPLAVPELMARGITTAAELDPLIAHANVIAVGPGLGQSAWGIALLAHVLETRLPLIMDADALNLLALDPLEAKQWILTPHPGEAARLLQTTVADIQADRFQAATMLQQCYGGVIVLKGSGTLITGPAGKTHVCTAGNAGMATGGMGDVLTGVIAGLLAQGLDAETAAIAGVNLHAAAGDMAARDGERGMLATDLMPWIRRLANPHATLSHQL
jgi:NAD(P)H-hydrate epimerase